MLIFGLAGPPIGTLVMVALFLFETELTIPDYIFETIGVSVIGLPFGYGVGIIPALGAALIDGLLAPYRWRALLVGGASFVLCALVLDDSLFSIQGLVGLVPAVLCSRLARHQTSPDERISIGGSSH